MEGQVGARKGQMMVESRTSADENQTGDEVTRVAESIPKLEIKLTSDPTPTSFASLLATAIAPIVAIGGSVGVLLLSLGWSYAWHWFAAWNVPFASLGLGPDVLLEYGRLVVLHFWWAALIWFVLVAAGGWAVFHYDLGKSPFILLCLAAFLTPWFASHHLGKRAAGVEVQQIQRKQLAGLPGVILTFQPGLEAALTDRVRSSLGTGCNLLLFKASDGLWLLWQRTGGWGSETIFIPNEAILHVRLRRPSGEQC